MVSAWGWRDEQPDQKKNLSIGIGFTVLLGCLMLILIYLNMILFALLISVISFQSFYYFEKSTYDFKQKDEDYKKFRRML